MEKDITLDTLSERHPEVEKEVNKVTVDFEVPSATPPDGGRGRSVAKIVRDVIIGIVVAVIMIFVGPYVAAYVP